MRVNIQTSENNLVTAQTRIPASPARKTSEFFDRINNLDPVKFRPLSGTEMELDKVQNRNAHLTYSSVTGINPFADKGRITRFSDFADLDDAKTPIAPLKLPAKAYKPPGIVVSKSEGDIGFRSVPSSLSNGSEISQLSHSSDSDHRVRFSEDTIASTASRGRSLMRRTPSPMKELEDIQEVSPNDHALPRTPKRSRSPMKRMFGEGGWLGKSMSMKELPSEEHRRSGLKHWGGKVKERVGNFTEHVSRSVPRSLGDSPFKTKSPAKSTFHVSLSPPMQAKLYSELELMICATANSYLINEAEKDRMSIESLQKIMNFWSGKNRPQVIEFMFDQTTQRELIELNLKTFRFHGKEAFSFLAMSSVMHAWKAMARDMSVRTFCAADSVVKQHIRITERVLEVLGAPVVTFSAFREITDKAHRIMYEQQKTKHRLNMMKSGVETRWSPKKTREEIERLEMENPFA